MSELSKQGALAELLERLMGAETTARLLRVLVVPEELVSEREATRAVVAQALNMMLFADLLERVPAAARYVERAEAAGRTMLHDHGAVRTVALSGMGSLPPGEGAITRLLQPLGYALRGVYPLERLKMTGRSYAHVDRPEEIAQFFISELHVERFSPAFQETVARVTRNSRDPLTAEGAGLLGELERHGTLSLADAGRLLPVLAACFERQHPEVSESDYEALLQESAEMAWIATEGNAFNHVTDRVADVDALTEEQKTLGEAIKATVERSGSGRVRQTAFLAARVQRQFVGADGAMVEREVPGSFLEFITRLPEENGGLDLSFDPANAQAIFKMTAGV